MLSSLLLSLAAISSLHSTAALQDYIIYRAMDNGVRPDLALAIIKAESGFDIDAKNKTSTASGLAQFINGTAQLLCIDKYKLATDLSDKNNPFLQVECLVRRLSEPNGIKEWDSSRPIWTKYLTRSLDAV